MLLYIFCISEYAVSVGLTMLVPINLYNLTNFSKYYTQSFMQLITCNCKGPRNCKSVGTLHVTTHQTKLLDDMDRKELIEKFRAYCAENDMDFSLDDIELIYIPDGGSLASNFFSSGVIGQTLRRNCLNCHLLIQGQDCLEVIDPFFPAILSTYFFIAFVSFSVNMSLLFIPILPLAIVVGVVISFIPSLRLGSTSFIDCKRFARIMLRILCVPLALETQNLYGKEYILLDRRGLFTVSEEELEQKRIKNCIAYTVKDFKISFLALNELARIRFEVEETGIPGLVKLSRHTFEENAEENISAAVISEAIAARIIEHFSSISNVV